MPEVTLSGYIVVPSADLDAVVAELPNHIRLTLNEPGCIEFCVNRDKDTPMIYHVSERFESAEAFSEHRLRVRASRWGSITANVERHYKTTGLEPG